MFHSLDLLQSYIIFFSYISLKFAAMQRCKGFGIPLMLYPTVEIYASLVLRVVVRSLRTLKAVVRI
jgi:hypothetical protein